MSILGDGLMGALNVGRGYLQDDIKREAESYKADETAARQEATDIRRDDMAQKRLLVSEQLREEMGIRKDENKRATLQKEGDEIDVETGKIDLKRSSGLINSIRNSVPNEGEFANKELSAEDIETIRTNMSPADAEKLYGIKPRTALSMADDQIAAAKNVGAFNSRPALIEQRKQLADTDKQDRLERAKQAETERKTTKDDNDAKAKDRREDARDEANRIAILRIEKNGEIAANRLAAAVSRGNSGSGSEKVMSYMDGQRKEIASEASDLNKQMSEDMKTAFDDKDKAKVRAQYQPRIDAIAKQREQLNKDFGALRGKFNLPPIEESAKAPTPAPQKTSSATTPSRASQFKVIR